MNDPTLRPIRGGRRVGLHPYKIRVHNDVEPEKPHRTYTVLATASLDARMIAFALDGGFGWRDEAERELIDGEVELAVTWTEVL